MRQLYVMGYYSTFPSAIPRLWAGYSRVTRPSATVHESNHPERFISSLLVRLACVRHAASVRPEPGSNSRSKWSLFVRSCLLTCLPKFVFSALSRLTIHQVLPARLALINQIYPSHLRKPTFSQFLKNLVHQILFWLTQIRQV